MGLGSNPFKGGKFGGGGIGLSPGTKAGIQVEGLEDAIKAFRIFPNEVSKTQFKVFRGAIATVRKEARALAPKAEAPFLRYFRGTGPIGTVKPGTLRKAIKSRAKSRRGIQPGKFKISGELFITEGSRDEKDAFYWRFVEYGVGSRGIPARPFIRPAAKNAERNIESLMSKQLEIAIQKVIKTRKN